MHPRPDPSWLRLAHAPGHSNSPPGPGSRIVALRCCSWLLQRLRLRCLQQPAAPPRQWLRCRIAGCGAHAVGCVEKGEAFACAGTCTTGNVLLKFKSGAFVPGAPVVPVTWRYNCGPNFVAGWVWRAQADSSLWRNLPKDICHLFRLICLRGKVVEVRHARAFPCFCAHFWDARPLCSLSPETAGSCGQSQVASVWAQIAQGCVASGLLLSWFWR